MKKNWKFLVLAATIGIFASCASTAIEESKHVAQQRIYQDYSINIDEGAGTSRARAQFRFGDWSGTTLRLSDASNVTVNGDAMGGDEAFLQGFVYSKSGVTSEGNKFDFVFTDVNGKAYTNSVTVKTIAFKDLPAEMDKGATYTIAWEGEPLGPNETVTVNLTTRSPEGQTSLVMATSSTEGATSVTMNSSQLQSAHPGSGTLTIKRSSSVDLQDAAEVGGKIAGSYDGKSASVTITGAPVQSAPAQGAPEDPMEEGGAAPEGEM